MAESLQRALTMPLRERRCRNRALVKSVRGSDVHSWYRAFLGALQGAPRPSRG
jgi:trehalose 6-phosphate synthase